MTVPNTGRLTVIDATRVDNGNAASGEINKLNGKTLVTFFANFTRSAAGAENLTFIVEISDDDGDTWFSLPFENKNTSPNHDLADVLKRFAVASASQKFAFNVGPFVATDIKITAELDSGGGSSDVLTLTARCAAIG